jgi:hypothetical protein
VRGHGLDADVAEAREEAEGARDVLVALLAEERAEARRLVAEDLRDVLAEEDALDLVEERRFRRFVEVGADARRLGDEDLLDALELGGHRLRRDPRRALLRLVRPRRRDERDLELALLDVEHVVAHADVDFRDALEERRVDVGAVAVAVHHLDEGGRDVADDVVKDLGLEGRRAWKKGGGGGTREE